MNEIIQGSNSPIFAHLIEPPKGAILELSAVLSHTQSFSNTVQILKRWDFKDVTISDWIIMLPLLQQETNDFPVGKAVLEIKFKIDLDHTVYMVKPVRMDVIDRKDERVLGIDQPASSEMPLLDMIVETQVIYKSGGEGGTVDHALLHHLGFDDSGHTGFQRAFSISDNLKFNGSQLDVNTTTTVEADNTRPVTSAAVNTVVGNISALLDTI